MKRLPPRPRQAPYFRTIPDLTTEQKKRFHDRADKSGGPTACWLWTARLDEDGYGVFDLERGFKAHRVAFSLATGRADFLELDHICRVRSCINPAHLEQVSHWVNVLRGTSWAAQNARRTLCTRGHALEGENLTLLWESREGRYRRRCLQCKRASEKLASRSYRIRKKAKKLGLVSVTMHELAEFIIQRIDAVAGLA